MVNIEKETTDEIISKKELLQLTKISYGQLYRWKRMNIIPEDWFIKKSTSTGQETFFKKDKILERIETILSMKDDVSLEAIANLFNKKETDRTISITELEEKGVVSKMALEVLGSINGNQSILGKEELILLSVIDKYLINSVITLDEFKNLANIIRENFNKLYSTEGKIVLYRKLGVSMVIGGKQLEELVIDPQAIKIVEVDLQKEVAEMNRGIMN